MNASESNTSEWDADIAIVGCGPVGATLALLLANYGLSSVVLDKENAIYPLPRAVHFDDQIMRVFQSIGIAEELIKVIRYNPGMRFVDPKGDLLLDWPRPSGISENGWHSSYRFHQPDLETLLRTRLAEHRRSQLISNAEVTDLQQTDSGCVTSFKHRKSGQLATVKSRYVVGCDGANSTVRKFIGEGVDDLGFNERWIVIDVLLSEDKPELGDFTIQHCGGERPSTYVRGPANRRRWEISLNDTDDSHQITSDDSIWNLLSPWLSPSEATIERRAVYEFKSTVAKQWRNKRLFIAGDAAHLTPPFMGQGMCAGIRDVANLAWKLAVAVKRDEGECPSVTGMLDSYQQEREPNVKQYITTAIGLGVLLNSCRTKESLDKAFPNVDGVVQMSSIVPGLGEGLKAGSTEHQGHWFPQPLLADGSRLDDVMKNRAVVLLSSNLWKDYLSSGQDYDGQLQLLFSDDEPEIAKQLDARKTQAVLLRPDYYLMGSANNVAELNSMLVTASAVFSALYEPAN